MKVDTVLDYAVFELSPKHSRCELFVSCNGENEKLASGLIEPFVNHLRVLESQASQKTQSSFRLEVEKSENDKSWFTRRTLERFVQFVNSPVFLERVNTFDVEMSQLEAARTLYSQEDGGVADATKKELLRAIDLRLEAIKKDLTTAIAHASANGFDPQTVSDLQHFADRFGAHHLDESCGKYISLSQRRPELITKNLNTTNAQTPVNETSISQHQSTKSTKNDEEEKKEESLDESSTFNTSHHTRRLSVQDRINLFESKQKENSNAAGNKPAVVAKSTELRSAAPEFPKKTILRRWSIVSDMSFDLALDNKKSDSSSTEEGPSTTPSSLKPDATMPKESEENNKKGDDDVKVTNSDGFQNQTDMPGSIMADVNSRETEGECYVSKSHNVAEPSVMFPYRHSRSQSAHISGGVDIQSDEPHSKERKKEMFPSVKLPALTTSPKPVSEGSEKRQQLEYNDLEVSLVNADPAGKTSNNRVRATSVVQMQGTRMSRESSPGLYGELNMKANDLETIFAEHNVRVHPAGDGKDNGNIVMRGNKCDLRFSDDSKGKLYEEYMKKRDAKLREERSCKETKLKSMQEALDQSRSEMKALFSAASTKRQDSLSNTRQRAEKFRSFNSRTCTKKYQHPIRSLQSSLQSEEENEKDKPVSGQSIGKSASRSSQVRKVPSPNWSSRVSKPSGKVSNTNINTSGKGRRTSEINLVAKSSHPKFSDLKKENTKPSSLAVRNTTTMMRTQVRSSSNKKTTKEDILYTPVMPRRPRSLRKSFSANIEFTEFTTLNSDDMINKERNQKQSTDIDDVSEENLKNEEFNNVDSEAEEEEEEEEKGVLEDPVKEEEEAREMSTLVVEDIGDETHSLTEKVDNSSEDENFTSLRSVSHVDLPVNTLPSSKLQHTFATLMDSPSDSPLSWNSNLQHAFSYPHEHSDVDASVDDSPMGSPASWSSRMRKKWGTTVQSPVIVPNSRKDLTKGIKRFLKFGKKTRAADSLMDWVSVTTSEGDDDFAYRSSDELRKSRMAYSQSQLSEDEQGSNNSIQAHQHQDSFKVKDGEFKRSFFSLSTFRSKGNESKQR